MGGVVNTIDLRPCPGQNPALGIGGRVVVLGGAHPFASYIAGDGFTDREMQHCDDPDLEMED